MTYEIPHQSLFRVSRLRFFYPVKRLKHLFDLRLGGRPPKSWKFPSCKEYACERSESRFKDAYHIGRVRYFVENGIVDPIEIDNVCDHGNIYAVPIIIDGHHRFWAAIIRCDETIPVCYGGRLDLHAWLSGITRRRPID
jgi:hypothetical protein